MKKIGKRMGWKRLLLGAGVLAACTGLAFGPRTLQASEEAQPVQEEQSAQNPESAGRYRSQVQSLIDWVKADNGQGADDSLFSGGFLDKAGTTAGDWYGIAVGRLGLSEDYEGYLSALRSNVKKRYDEEGGLDPVKATEWHRIALTVLSLGGDPADMGKDKGGTVIDLIADGTYGFQEKTGHGLETQGLNGLVWSLLTLDAMDYSVPQGKQDRQQLVSAILDRQNEDGGFGLSGPTSDVDVTAMAVAALAPYREEARTAEAVEKACDYLGKAQQPDGDFLSGGEANSESVSQVIIALCSAGIDPLGDQRFVKGSSDLLDGLAKYQQADGGYAHSLPGESNSMAGGQALCALAALERYYGNYPPLFDMKEPGNDSGTKGYIVNVYTGEALEDSREAQLFDEEDLEAYRALPAAVTTKYSGEVNRLLEKLQSAENRDEYTAVLTGLRNKKEEIDQIQKEINAINTEISAHFLREEDWNKMDAKDALLLEDRINELSDYDRSKIEGYDQLLKAEKELMTGKRSSVITVLIVIAVAVIILWILLDWINRKKKKKAMESLRDLADGQEEEP